MLTRRYQLLLLAVIVLAAFYPAVLGDFSRIDDGQLAESLRGKPDWNLCSLFIPFASGGLYYRPLIGLSYLIDAHFLGLHPGLMHLENVLLHLANAVLVYFITLHIVTPGERDKSILPFLGAIFFGLHPITTESVNWISGRTDLLSGTFILLSAVFLLKFNELRSKKYAVLALVSFLGGALAKETALAFLPGALLLTTTVPRRQHDLKGQHEALLERPALHGNTTLILGVVVVALLVYSLRSIAFTSNINRIGLTIMAISDDWMHSLFVMLRAFGFYVKKVFAPFPLNFAIVEVDPLYEVLAVPLVALCLYIATRRTLVSAVFSTGVILIIPSFIIAFGQISWTPYAERYIYLSTAFIVCAVVVYLKEKITHPLPTGLKVSVSVVLAMLFMATLNRSAVWQNDYQLCKDTVEISPSARDMRLMYSTVLTERGDYSEALKQLEQGRKIPRLEYDERFDLNTARIYYHQDRLDEAIRFSEVALQKSRGGSVRALEFLIYLSELQKVKSRSTSEKRLLDKKIFAYNLQLYKRIKDPRLLYDLGEGAAALGEYARAIRLFQQARRNLRDSDPYKKFAQKRIETLAKVVPHQYAEDF